MHAHTLATCARVRVCVFCVRGVSLCQVHQPHALKGQSALRFVRVIIIMFVSAFGGLLFRNILMYIDIIFYIRTKVRMYVWMYAFMYVCKRENSLKVSNGFEYDGYWP